MAITARYIQSERVTLTLTMRPSRVLRWISHLSISPKPLVVSVPPVSMFVTIRVPDSHSNASLRRRYPSPDVSRLVATSRSCAFRCSVWAGFSPAFIFAISWLMQ